MARTGNSSRIERQITNLIRHALRAEVEPDGNALYIIGAPDLAFRDAKVAVFVDGCYWHGCPTHSKREDREQRQAADARVTEKLASLGWVVLRVWEHEEHLGPFIDDVVSAVLEGTQQKTRWIGAHLAAHSVGEWCFTCETWPHAPLVGSDGACKRCGLRPSDHGDDTFAFPVARIQEAHAAHNSAA